MWRAGPGKHNRMMAVILVLLVVAFCTLLRTNTEIGGFLYACMVVCFQILEGCLLTFFGKSFFQQRYHTEIFDDIVRSNWNWHSHFLWHCAAYEVNVNWNQGAEWGGKGTMNILDLFQGLGTMFVQSPSIVIARIVLIFLGFLLVQSLLLSAIGGIVGGYVIYFLRKGNFNPTVGIAGVSCVPSTAKVAQKAVSKENPAIIILDYALGANICGVITTAILTGIYITLLG